MTRVSSMGALPKSVEICEVGPRDGLQRLPQFVPTERKIRFVRDLVDAGFKWIEVTSFVSAKSIPQLLDARDVLKAVAHPKGVSFAAFVPNARGLDPALELGVDCVSIATYASDEFGRKNVNATIRQANDRIREVVRAAAGTKIAVRGYVSVAFHCPFTGPVPPERVVALVEELLEAGCSHAFIGDTTGRGTPGTAARLADLLLERIPADRIGVHFHDTMGQGVANVLECLKRGIAIVDTSVAGLGGCPAAEGAAGNVATEDVLVMLGDLGLAPAVDVERVAAIGAELCRDLGIRNDSKAGRALTASPAGTVAGPGLPSASSRGPAGETRKSA